ncbi:unnamed protein product [Prorocentrum cordatum]|uniref:Uncharacterized protein n=1 Tax=Prorocentrum cordatum TaxID=2364126 RepID=A0ABN9T5L7_9DINO|nr:unnamed protein product [Polarella glacialis]
MWWALLWGGPGCLRRLAYHRPRQGLGPGGLQRGSSCPYPPSSRQTAGSGQPMQGAACQPYGCGHCGTICAQSSTAATPSWPCSCGWTAAPFGTGGMGTRWRSACWPQIEEIGYPEHRPRIFISGGLHETMVSLLPEDPQLVTEKFLSFFGGVPRGDVSIVCGLDGAAAQLEARKKFCSGDPNVTIDCTLADFTKGKKKRRILQYLKDVGNRKGVHSDAVCCDLGQNWEAKRGSASPYLPSAVKNAEQVVFFGPRDKKGRVLTPQELDFSRGWPSFINAGNRDWAAELGIAFQQNHFGLTAHRKLHGNGVSLPAWAAWYVFFMSYTVRRNVVLEFRPDWGASWQTLMGSVVDASSADSADANGPGAGSAGGAAAPSGLFRRGSSSSFQFQEAVPEVTG